MQVPELKRGRRPRACCRAARRAVGFRGRRTAGGRLNVQEAMGAGQLPPRLSSFIAVHQPVGDPDPTDVLACAVIDNLLHEIRRRILCQ